MNERVSEHDCQKIIQEFSKSIINIYATMIYKALCIMFWMRAYPLRGEVGGGWALEFPSFLGPVCMLGVHENKFKKRYTYLYFPILPH